MKQGKLQFAIFIFQLLIFILSFANIIVLIIYREPKWFISLAALICMLIIISFIPSKKEQTNQSNN